MSQSRGRVFLVGAGPGASDLITLRGQRCLAEAEVVLYDDLTSPALLQEVPESAETIYVGKREGRRVMEQEAICRLMVERARAGRRVVRLKGGDPFIFGRGGEEAEALARAGVPFEVVPGVSAAAAVPAHAGIPLTHRDHADGFEVLSGHDPARAPRRTVVVLMAMRHLAETVQALLERGHAPDLPAAVIQWGTLARQRTVSGTLADIAELAREVRSPAVLVAGEVVRLRERLRWFETRPLFGRRVLVTRGRHQAAETCRLLEGMGAEAITLPTIAILPPEDPEQLLAAVRSLAGFDILILTSANGVEALARAMEQAGLDSRALAGLTLCAIGPGTSRALAALGLRPDLVPGDHRAEGILDLLPAELVQRRRVLLLRAARAREVLPRTLAERGAQVEVVAAYVTGFPPAEQTRPGLARLRAGEVDVLTFTSASTVTNLAAMVEPDLPRLGAGKVVAAIGPVTREACLRAGLAVDVMPDTYTLPAMVEALAAHLARAAAEGR